MFNQWFTRRHDAGSVGATGTAGARLSDTKSIDAATQEQVVRIPETSAVTG